MKTRKGVQMYVYMTGHAKRPREEVNERHCLVLTEHFSYGQQRVWELPEVHFAGGARAANVTAIAVLGWVGNLLGVESTAGEKDTTMAGGVEKEENYK